MPGETFRIAVEAIMNPTSLNAYEAAAEAAMKRLDAAAQSGTVPAGQLQSQTRQVQIASQVGAQKLAEAGVTPGESYAITSTMRAGFDTMRDTYGIQLLQGTALKEAVLRGSNVAGQAQSRQQRADELRLIRANEDIAVQRANLSTKSLSAANLQAARYGAVVGNADPATRAALEAEAAKAAESAIVATRAAEVALTASRSLPGAGRATALSGGALFEPGGRQAAAEAADIDSIRRAKVTEKTIRDAGDRTAARSVLLGVSAEEGEALEHQKLRNALATKRATIERQLGIERAIEGDEAGIRSDLVKVRALHNQNARTIAAEAKLNTEAAGPGGGGGGGLNILGGGGGKLLATAAAAAGIYTAAQSVTALVKEAENAQVVLGQLEIQMDSVGKGHEFATVRDEILDMSAATGIAVDKVAGIASIMVGAFEQTSTAILATQAGLDAMQVGGLKEDQVKNLFVAIPQAFGLTDEAIAGINDEMLHLKDTFGVSVSEISEGVGSIAPLAHEVGLSFTETATLVAAAAASSGRSASQVAGELGRALTQIEKQAVPILQLFERTPALQDRLPQVQADIGQGRTGQVLLEVARGWTSLTHAQQENFLQLVGGRREFASLAAAMGASERVIRELDDTSTHEGRTARSLADFHKTLAFGIDQAQEAFRQLGVALVRAGLGEALGDLAQGAGAVLHLVTALANGFGIVNEATNGWLGHILALIVAIKALNALSGVAVTIKTFAAGAAARGAEAFIAQGGLAAGAGAGARAGLGAAGAAAGFNPITVGVVGTAGVGITAFKQLERAQSAEKDNRAALEKLSDADLADMAAKHDSFWKQVGSTLYGTDTLPKIARELQKQRRYEAIAPELSVLKDDPAARSAVEDAFGFGGKEVGYDKIVAAAAGGDKTSLTALETVLAKVRQDPGKRGALDGALAAAQKVQQEATDLEKVSSGDLAASTEATKAAYEAGTASFAQYLKAKEAEISTLKGVVAGGTADQAIFDQLTKAENEKNKLVSAKARSLADAQIALAEQTGDSGPQTTVNTLTALLNSGKLSNPDDQLKAATDIVTAQKAILAEQANMADTAAEKLAILQAGIAIPEEVRVVELTNELNVLDVTWQALFESLTSNMEEAADLAKRVARRSIEDGIGTIQALRLELQAEIDAEAANNPAGRGEGLEGIAGDAHGSILGLAQADEKRKRLAALPPDLQDYQAPSPTQRATSDQLASAQRAADAEAEAAAKAAHAEEVAISKARLALRKAQAEGDPVAQAQAGIEEAELLMASAEKESERIAAQAQLVTAQHQLALAQQSVADAYRNIDKALAQAAGDTVKVAELEIAQAREHLDNARGRGDQLGALAAEAELIGAQAGAVAAQIATSERNTDFLLTMEKITTGQAIAQLEALLKIPGITQEQTQQLLLKIQQLRKSASADVAFNIPDDIKLPTIYEVRRANAAAEHGTSYNDSRQININVTANNAGELDAQAQAFADAFSGPPRVGTTPRRY